MYVHHGSTKGGAPRSLAFLINNINKEENKITVICREDLKNAKKMYESLGAKVEYEPHIHPFHGSVVSGITFKQFIYNLVYALPTFFRMKKIILNTPDLDIVHLNSTCLFMCAMAVKKTNKDIKVICHIREPLLPNFFGNILKRMNLKYVDEFIAIDNYDARTVDKNLTKTKVIYNFVDFNQFNADIKSNILRKELKISSKETVCLNLARISPENGMFEIVKKWNKFKEELVGYHLVIVGEDPKQQLEYTSKVKEEAKENKTIHILPFRNDVVDIIASSDIMICSFVKPHFARSIIEASAMGIPSIAPNIEGPKELILNGKTGMFFDINSDDSFLNALLQIKKEISSNNNMKNEAIKFAKKNFSADINSKKTFDIYEKLKNKIREDEK